MKALGVAEVTDADFAGEVLGEPDRPVLVEFTADWCGPCRQLAPVLSEIAREESDRIKILQLDVDRSPETAIAYRVLSAPTMIVFRGGEPVLQLVGARAKRKLLAELADVL
ncbi:thioredoxin family protein [Streptomyces kanamyceticus]|uniref:Thioredoxin n=1 Tax=Streptomyces kanamyceticus TaxID=1967 RepID=A0A5J6GU11_STRKN|nr:thioredoxin domain-containing protein [Streptomyces kanamyceticus]QEU97308.1 thiol reductase thioredoxin [Streptomyces kanamyceticus]